MQADGKFYPQISQMPQMGKRNLCNRRNLRISHSALRNPNSAIERLFSGFHFGMDDWGERGRLACGVRRPRRMRLENVRNGTLQTATGTVALPIPNSAGATGRGAHARGGAMTEI
jgi:hypothetical protein